MPEQDVPKLVHELQVHQVELEMQNDELRRTQLGLEEASDRYLDLYDFAASALLTLSERGDVLEANLAAAALLGLERRKLLEQKFSCFIPADAQNTFHLYCQQVLHSGIKQIRELTLKSATGRRLTVRLEGIAAQGPKTHQTQCRLSLNDITASKEAEAALVAVNARLNGVISSAMDAMISVDARQHVVLFNPAAEMMYGISAQEALGQSLGRFIPERYRAAHVRHVSQYGETGVSSRSMGRLGALLGLRASGEEFPIEATISQVEIQGAKLFTVILRDITERKKAEEALQDMALFSQENVSPVLRVARDGTLLYANPPADSLLTHWQCGPGGKVPEFVHQTVTAVLASGVSQELELNHAGRDLCFAVTPLGGRNYVNLYASDITDRKRLHEMYRLLSADLEQRVTERTAEARESEARYRSLVTATAQFVWTLNAKGELLEDLPAWRAFTGQSYDEIKGWGWASALHPDDLERTRAAWQHAVATRTLHEIEYRMRRHDGEYRYFAVRGVPVTEPDGSVREWVCACTDITERKAARARRNATNALLGLFARKSSSKEYLGGVIKVIRAWSDCQCVGIRVADQHGAIPYNA
jgi:PAS domain S-box-containing protein